MKRILVIQVNWLGDVLFTTPFLTALRAAHPDAYIACLMMPRCREVLEGNPAVDNLFVYDEEGPHRLLPGKWRVVRSLRAHRFDEAYILHRSMTKALMAKLAGIPRLVGYPTKRRGWLLTDKAQGSYDAMHRVEYYLGLARVAGCPNSDPAYVFHMTPGDEQWAQSFFREQRYGPEHQIVALNPGANRASKRWPAEFFAELGQQLVRQGVRVILTGGPGDKPLADAIAVRIGPGAAVAAGKTTLKQSAALFAKAHVVVANDSGPMHIAVAVSAKVVALFGPTSPRICGPYGRGTYTVLRESPQGPDSPLAAHAVDDSHMRALSVNQVLQAVHKYLPASNLIHDDAKP